MWKMVCSVGGDLDRARKGLHGCGSIWKHIPGQEQRVLGEEVRLETAASPRLLNHLGGNEPGWELSRRLVLNCQTSYPGMGSRNQPHVPHAGSHPVASCCQTSCSHCAGHSVSWVCPLAAPPANTHCCHCAVPAPVPSEQRAGETHLHCGAEHCRSS